MNRVHRALLVASAANALKPEDVNDLPAIRQAINDKADSYRKDGWFCPDFAQDEMVRRVQVRLQGKGLDL